MDLEQISLECRADKLTAETQRAQRGRRESNIIQASALSLCPLRLGGELLYSVPYTQVNTALDFSGDCGYLFPAMSNLDRQTLVSVG